jgi:hypothetical protein
MKKRVEIVFQDTDAEHLADLVKATGLRTADLIRRCVLGVEIPAVKHVPEVNRQTYAALARACASLNQIAATANSAGLGAVDPAKFKGQLAELVQQTRAAQLQVLGSGE